MREDIASLNKMEELLSEYEEVVQAALKERRLKINTAHTYLLHARNFVRWCKGEFEPGAKNK